MQNLVKFCPLVLKILSRNEILTSIKSYSSVANMQKMTLMILSMLMCIQSLVNFCLLVLKILSGNEMVTELRKSGIAELRKDRANQV